MNRNPILEELYAVREQLLAEAGGTLHGLVAMLHAEESHSPAKQTPPACTMPPKDERVLMNAPTIAAHSR